MADRGDEAKEEVAEGEAGAAEELPVTSTCVIIKPHVLNKKVTAEDDGFAEEQEGEEDDDDDSDAGRGPTTISVVEDIRRKLKADGWTIVRENRTQISGFDAVDMCAHLSKNKQFDQITGALVAAPLVALEVSKRGDAVEMMKKLVGASEDPDAERKSMAEQNVDKSQWSFRALYGVNAVYNGVSCSSDTFSRDREMSILFPSNEGRTVTCCIIKPDAMLPMTVTVTEGVSSVERTRRPWEEIKAAVEANNFVVLAQKEVKLSVEDLERLYPDSKEEEWFKEQLVPHMTNGKSTIMALEGLDAISKWRMLMGPEDPEQARIVAPKSLRALFGKDPVKNAIAGSRSSEDADRELSYWFPSGFPVERTLAMVKPLAASKHVKPIVAKIQSEGFTIIEQQRVHLSKERAEQFYAEHDRRAFFGDLTDYMSSGPVYVMVLSKPGAIKHWRRLCGPTNTAKAKAEAPASLRALYGTDGTRNAVHGSDAAESSDREVSFFFPLILRRTAVGATDARKFLSTTPAGAASVSRTLHSVVIEGITELCKIKPVGLDAVRWLGRWFLENNPNRPRIEEPADDATADLLAGYDFAAAAAAADTKEAGGAPAAAAAEAKDAGDGVAEAAAGTDVTKSDVVFLLGGPGSGKTEVCKRICDEFGYVPLSTSSLLKAELDRGTPLGLEIKEAMSRGELVPLETVLRVLKVAMQRSSRNKFVLDGYPRQLSQAFAFEQQVCKCKMVIYLDVAEGTMRKRLKQGGGVSDEMVNKRLVVYRDFCRPVVSLYKKLGKVIPIDAEQSPDSVWTQIQTSFVKQIIFVVGGPESRAGKACAAMTERFGFVRLSTQDLVAKEIASGSRVGQHLDALTRAGRLVPHDITMQLLRQAFENSPKAKFMIEGFPRTLDEAIQFEEHIGSCTQLLHLKCPASVLRQRFRQRWSGVAPPLAERIFEKHLEVFSGQTQEVLGFYRQCGLVSDINADQPATELVKEIRSALLPNVFFVVGGPGSGTSDLCARVARDLDLTHLNVGALLRAEIARGSEVGQSLDRIIRSGQIVPVEKTLALLKQCFDTNLSGGGSYVIDEWPRALDQAQAFEAGIASVTRVIYLRADAAALRRRATEMDKDRFARRMALFSTQTMPVIDYYAHKGIVDTIDIDGVADDDALYAAFKPLFVQQMVMGVAGPGIDSPKLWNRVESEFGFKRVSTAALVQAEHKRGTATGKLIRGLLDANKMVPSQIVMRLLRNVLSLSGASRRFVVEGFPKDLTELQTLKKMIGAPQFCVYLQQAKEAYLKEATSEEETAQFEKRFDQFRFQMMPLMQAMESAKKLQRIDVTTETDPFQVAKKHFMPKITLLVGCTGTGRGDVATYLGREHAYARVHVTSLLQQESESGSDAGTVIKRCLAMKRTVPTEVVLSLVLREVRRLGRSDILLDGFPRLVSWAYPLVHDQAFALDAISHVQRVIVLKCSKAEKLRRCPDVEAVEAGERTLIREKMPVVQHYEQSTRVPVVKVNTDDIETMKTQLKMALGRKAPRTN